MYSKTEASEIKQAFWTAFGQYMALQPRAELGKINWINYKTGVKHLYFKMDADGSWATISIEMNHPDLAIQALMFEQFQELKNLLENSLHESWDWQLYHVAQHGKKISLIEKRIDQVSIYKKEDWPSLITFFKHRIIALDNFWSDAQFMFELFM
jgi:hypothetical protein